MRTRLLCGVAAMVIGASVSAQFDLKSWVTVGERAFQVFPPACASQGQVESLNWSPDGRYLAILRSSNQGHAALMRTIVANPEARPEMPRERVIFEVYDTVSRRTTVTQEYLNPVVTDAEGRVQPSRPEVTLHWMAATSYVFAVVGTWDRESAGYQLERIDVRTGQREVVSTQPSLRWQSLALSPTKPNGVWLCSRDGVAVGIPLVQGRHGQPLEVAGIAQPSWGAAEPRWNREGDRLALVGMRRANTGRYDQVFQELDLSTLTARAIEPFETAEPARPFLHSQTLPLQTGLGPMRIKTNVGVLLAGQPSEKDQPAVIGFDVSTAAVSPSLKHVAYVSQGLALVSELVEAPKELYERAKAAAERTEKMLQAKQVATGLAIFAADNDDRYPSNKEDWQKMLAPYLKNNSLMEGFVYTFAGGNLSDIENPSKTEVGFISLPGGRVVAYADTSVRWVQDVP